MRTDRELLELAAKACALPECGWMADTFTYVKDNTFTTWNPLADDADAFRLMVKLRLWRDGPVLCVENVRDHNGDACAATRRAIVRAAAELGALL